MALELVQRRDDCAALRVAHHDDEARSKAGCGEFHAADLRWGDDIARHADDEQIAESLVEDELGRHARVRAPEDDGKGFLAAAVVVLVRGARQDASRGLVRDKTRISFAQAGQRFRCANHAPESSYASNCGMYGISVVPTSRPI